MTIRERSSSWLAPVLALASLALVYKMRNLLVPFALAGGAALALEPVVKRIQSRSALPRPAVASLVLAVALIVSSGAAWWGFQRAWPSLQGLLDDPNAEVHNFVVQSIGGEQATLFGRQIDAATLAAKIVAHATRAAGGSGAATLARVATDAAYGVIIFFVLLFYGVAEGPHLVDGAINLAPPEHRPRLLRLSQKAYPMLQRYFLGIFIVVVFTSLTTWICIGPIFHLPCAVGLALATGVLEIVPVIGPTASMTLLSIVAVMHGGTLWNFAGFGVFCFGLRLAIDQVVGPVVLGRAVRLPPTAVIFAFIAGGAVFGALGVLIAIPTVALAKIVLDDYYEHGSDS